MERIRIYLGMVMVIAGCMLAGCSSDGNTEQTSETESQKETVVETQKTDQVIDLSDIIYAKKTNIINQFGTPNAEVLHEPDEGTEYNYYELIYDDIVFRTDADEMEAINYFKTVTAENKYSFFGICVGMSKEELVNELDERLTLYTAVEPGDDPFADNEVTYQVLHYDNVFAQIQLENDQVSQIEFVYQMD